MKLRNQVKKYGAGATLSALALSATPAFAIDTTKPVETIAAAGTDVETVGLAIVGVAVVAMIIAIVVGMIFSKGK